MRLSHYIIPIAATLAITATAADVNYRTIPLPERITTIESEQPFILGGDVNITGDKSLGREVEFMREYLPAGLAGTSTGGINISADLVDSNPEAYMIEINSDGIKVRGASAAGAFYGVQTLRKALAGARAGETVEMPAAIIYDKPRFQYRGTHFDVSRHFFTLDEVKQFIDMIALHGVNTLHWHLTDDQGWRLEIKKYPRLTEVGSYRPHSILGHTGPGFDDIPVSGYYTQDEAREIVKYAADRHIQVIPEVDLPGHMMAAMASYPWLGCSGGPYEVWCSWGVNDGVLCPGKDSTLEFIADVLDEVMEIFPAPYMHIGGDECPKVVWQTCEHCQARIKELGLEWKDGVSPESQLQGYITAFATKVVRDHGKSAIGWDEILECDIPRDAVIMSWRGVEGAAEGAKRGHRVILTPTSHCYFDFYQNQDTKNEPYAIGGLTTVERVYSLEPCLPSMTPAEKELVMGCQANLWTEYIKDFPQVQYMELPRLAALSEVQWLKPEHKDYEDFKQRIPSLLAIYDRMGYNYARHIADVDVTYRPDSEKKSLIVTASALPGYDVRYTLDGSEPRADSRIYTAPVALNEDCVIRTRAFNGEAGGREVCDTLQVNALTFGRCTLSVDPDPGYAFGGGAQLTDGLSGAGNYRSGRWIGFSGKNCDATIELNEPVQLSQISFNVNVFSQDGLMDCREVEVYGRPAGKDEFELLAQESYPEMTDWHHAEVVNHTLRFEPRELSAVRVVIHPQWILPDAHHFRGCLGFVFVDEIKGKVETDIRY